MRSIKEIFEELITEANNNITWDEVISRPWRLVEVLEGLYKKYKRKFHKVTVGEGWRSYKIKQLKDFDPKKKYFIIDVESHGYKSSNSTFKVCFIYINDGQEIYKTHINGLRHELEIFNSNSDLQRHIDLNNTKYVYEVPAELEWLYDKIKNY